MGSLGCVLGVNDFVACDCIPVNRADLDFVACNSVACPVVICVVAHGLLLLASVVDFVDDDRGLGFGARSATPSSGYTVVVRFS